MWFEVAGVGIALMPAFSSWPHPGFQIVGNPRKTGIGAVQKKANTALFFGWRGGGA